MRWMVCLVVAGCSFNPLAQALDARRGDTPGSNGDARATPDGPGAPDAPAGTSCLGAGAFRVCVPTPTLPYAVHGVTNTGIDTDATGTPCTFVTPASGPTWCVVAGTTITIDEDILFGSGSHPLVLFATDTIEIGRGVDVGSHATGQAHGAGADSALCSAGSGAGSGGGGGAGGAGGSFGTKGGNGGAGGGTSNGDTAGQTTPADTLRGGCPGDDGGNGGGSTGGGGNHGGGAVLLLAGSSITITGYVNASGGGGGGGRASKGGGGGGGSGGMIAMAAPTITVTGKLAADGGGGGGGASMAGAGGHGFDPDPTMPLQAAGGGSDGGGQSGAGAAGAAGATPASSTGSSGDGAGGGGGGLGAIRILSGQTVGGTSSPTPTS